MASLSHKVEVFSNGSIVTSKPDVTPEPNDLWMVKWDDELAEFNFTSRTALDTWGWNRQTPAVFRYYPVMKENAGEFRVNMSTVEGFTHLINPTDRQWRYYTGPSAGVFNRTGWPNQINVLMSGNKLKGEPVNSQWFKFQTLTLQTANASAVGIAHFVHHWGIIGIRVRDGVVTVTHSEAVGSPQMVVYYPLMSKEGFGYIPLRYVRKI